ncbi:MAG: superinfection exclusion B family protein [Candidatus Dadabacteria bacterium]|nr:superinfection exclusion B family protein [Candidatus Dadabacteria bacterium]
MSINLDWYDKLVDFAKQKISVVFWFFICSAILLFSPDKLLELIYLDVVVSYIGPVIGFIFLASGILLLINLFIYGKNKYIKSNEVKSKKKLLKELKELYEIEAVNSGFKSQKDCIMWSNSVAPLLKFNEQYYANFMTNSHAINNQGMRGDLPASLFNTMKSQVEMAITELENELSE